MAELIKDFEDDIEGLEIVPSDGGRFEVMVNGTLIYSKLKTNRHAESGEVVALVRNFITDVTQKMPFSGATLTLRPPPKGEET